MSNKMLIDATHPEETRVVVLRGNRVEEFDFESASRKQLRGNIYLAKVTRVEPSLQAAFVDYGGNRHGFLAFSEIHPDYYQIPVADRQALLDDEARAHSNSDDEDDNGGESRQGRGEGRGERRGRRRHNRRGANRNRNRDVVRSDVVDGETENGVAENNVADAALTALSVGENDQAQPQNTEHTETTTPVTDNGDPVLRAEYERDAEEIVAGEATSRDVTPSSIHAEPASAEPVAVAAEPGVQLFDAPSTPKPAEAQDTIIAQSDAEQEGAGVLTESMSVTSDAAEPTPQAPEATADETKTEDAVAAAVTQDNADVAHADHANGEDAQSEDSHSDDLTARAPDGDDHNGDEDQDDDEDDSEDGEEEHVESVGGDAIEEVRDRTPRYRRHYKIQEVIKRRQVMLVQVVKEERGTKGAALTTYLSLAGRYSVLMPNTARGGGISRKVTNSEDRKHMKEIAEALEVPEGMGVILRTAGASRTKIEIKRDFEYLLRLWETVRDLTLKSTAPTLVYEEGSLIKRAIRDLYSKDIEEIIVEGESAYREAKDFMRMLMPSAVKTVVRYNDTQPIFTRYGIESQLDAMFQPTVQLKSGGYIVINQTEALVAIDVNSGRATREHSIEDTATKTNSEAAVEIARQLRLRDLAGLIVIDFIDMDEGRNNRAVERKLKDALKNDRARIQVGRISHFGLMEMSRQRIRSSVLESSTETCPHCGGTGHVRSVSSVALQVVRAVEEMLLKGATHNLIVRSRSDVAIYVLNHKRAHLRMLEERFKISIAVTVDPSLTTHPSFAIDRGEQVMSVDQAKAIAATIKPDSIPVYAGDEDIEVVEDEVLDEIQSEGEDTAEAQEQDESEPSGGRRRRRRGRRSRGRDGEGRDGEGRDQTDAPLAAEGEDGEATEAADADGEQPAGVTAEGAAEGEQDGEKRRRRRGRRGGRRSRGGREGHAEGADDNGADETQALSLEGEDLDQAAVRKESESEAVLAAHGDSAIVHGTQPDSGLGAAADSVTPAADSAGFIPFPASGPAASEQPAPAEAASRPAEQPAAAESEPVRRRSTVREAPPVYGTSEHAPASPAPVVSPVPAAPAEPEAANDTADAATAAQEKPRRFGWWSRK